MRDDYFDLMLKMAQKAGEMALEYQGKCDPTLKADKSVVTKADQAISEYIHQELKPFTDGPDHIIIEEEDPNHASYFDQELLDQTPYIWAVDPIDGTRPYVNDMPFYGVSIGLFKDLCPWMGAVYFPVLKELFICDGDKAYFVKNAFSSEELRREIIPIDEEISEQSILLCSETFYKYYQWNWEHIHAISPATAVAELCWPTIGRGHGGLICFNLWDLAGSWPIFQKAGLELRAVRTGDVLDRLDIKKFEFEKKSWRMKEYYLLSSKRNFEILKTKLQ